MHKTVPLKLSGEQIFHLIRGMQEKCKPGDGVKFYSCSVELRDTKEFWETPLFSKLEPAETLCALVRSMVAAGIIHVTPGADDVLVDIVCKIYDLHTLEVEDGYAMTIGARELADDFDHNSDPTLN